MVSEWINVDERLPDEGVAVWMRFGPRDAGYHMMVGSYDYVGDHAGWVWSNSYGSFWYDNTDRKWHCDGEADDDYRPTHWMPLPQPPEDVNAKR